MNKKFFLIVIIFISCAKRVTYKKVILKKEKLKEPEIKVLLYENKNPLWISATNIYFVKEIKNSKTYRVYSNQRIKILRNSGSITVFLEGKKTKLKLPLLFYSNSGFIKIEGKRYRGKIIIDEFLRVINQVKMEDYLRSVVPREIGSPYLSNFEALKAQAVCARTYALRKYFERRNNFFHLYSDIKDQVYGGRDSENEITNLAVEKTRGEILIYKNEIALALFHSTCGGKTAYFEEAFPGEKKVPYLKSVRCNFQGKDLCRNSPYYRWEKTYNVNNFKKMIAKNIKEINGINLDGKDILDFRISKRGRSGRVVEIRVKTKKGTFTFKGYEIRKIIRDKTPLPSTYFFFKKRGRNVIIIGRGFGHGVGLCQYGALSLSKKGVNYEYILKFYYPGTKIKKVY